jgi:hypothetical protein
MTFDIGSFNMERVLMAQKIIMIKKEYDISSQEFHTLIGILDKKIDELSESTRCCEDVLFEIFARAIKKHEISKWFSCKFIKDVFKDINEDKIPHKYDMVEDGIVNLKSGNLMELFIMYEKFDQTYDIPSFSVIHALNNMITSSIKSDQD